MATVSLRFAWDTKTPDQHTIPKTPMFGKKKRKKTKSRTRSLRLLYSLNDYGELGGGTLLSSVHYLCWSLCLVCLFVPWFSSHLWNVPMVALGLLRKSFPYLERMSSSDTMAAGHAVCMAMVEIVLQLAENWTKSRDLLSLGGEDENFVCNLVHDPLRVVSVKLALLIVVRSISCCAIWATRAYL